MTDYLRGQLPVPGLLVVVTDTPIDESPLSLAERGFGAYNISAKLFKGGVRP